MLKFLERGPTNEFSEMRKEERGWHRNGEVQESERRKKCIFLQRSCTDAPMKKGGEDGGKILSTNESTDRLSKLPREIQSSILSLMTMRDAVNTDVLSSEWRGLWRSLPHLEFDANNMFAEDPIDLTFTYVSSIKQESVQRRRTYLQKIIQWKRAYLQKKRQWERTHFQEKIQRKRTYFQEKIQRIRNLRFIRSVNTFLNHHTGTGVERFSVQFPLHQKNARHLDWWINFGISSGTKILKLDLHKDFLYSWKKTPKPYKIPCELFAGGRASSLVWLHLSSCVLRLPPNFDGFGSLTDLILEVVSMSDAAFHDLLPKCSSLECLHIYHCNWLVDLRICNMASRLKTLKVSCCHGVQSLMISSVNLAVIEYDGPKPKFYMQHLPQLLRAKLGLLSYGEFDDLDYFLTELPYDLPELETLTLQFTTITTKKWLQPPGSDIFTNLKHLTVRSYTWWSRDLLWIVSLLNAAPFIETFQLDLNRFRASVVGESSDVETARDMTKPPGHYHNHLKTVKINGFNGYINETEVALCILNDAIVLEELTIDPRYMEEQTPGDASWHAQPREEAIMGVEEAFKFLLAEAPSNVKATLLTC